MAENINPLVLPIGADISTFERAINEVKAAYKDLSNTISSTSFNLVTPEQKTLLNQYGETIKILTNDVKQFGAALGPPANSIAGLTLKIKELTAQKINLDATTSSAQIANLTKEIEKLTATKNAINELGKSIAAVAPQVAIPLNSIAGLDKKIKELNSRKINLDAKTSASEIARLNQEIDKLTAKRNNIDALGSSVQKIGQAAGSSFKKLEDSSKGGRIALTSLSLVAQDLPFGFIAIQNNLPAVIQSFGQLTTKAGGLKGALSAIGPLLLGPAGLFLAFSIVTSAVTFAVQKYGSLGAALDAIIGKQSKYSELLLEANKSYEKFNKEKRDSIQISNEEVASIQGSISKATSLASIVTDLTKSYNERNSALNDLKSLDKERFGNLDIEKTKLEDLTSALDNYISSLKAAAITKGFESAIGQTSVELAKQLKILDTLKDELADTKAAPVRFIGKADQIDTRDIDAATARIKEQDKVVNALRSDISLYNKEIDNSIKLQNSLQAPVDAANKALKDADKLTKQKVVKIKFDFDVPKLEEFLQFEKFFELDNSLKRLDNYADILLDVNAKESERKQILQSLQSESKKVLGQNTSLFDGLKIGTTNYKVLTQAVVNYGIAVQQAILDQQKLFADTKSENKFKISDYIAQGLKGVNFEDLDSDVIKNEFDKIKELSKGLPKDVMPSFEEFKTMLKELLTLESFKTTEGTLGLDQVTALTKDQLSILKKTIEEAKIQNALAKIFGNGEAALTVDENITNIIGTIKKVKDVIADSLERPFRQFFDTLLDEGKVTFKSFLDLFKDIIKRIASQLISSGIASLITSVLFPQTAVAGALGGAVAGGGPSGILKFLGKIFGIKKASGGVNFGGVESSGMQLAGQVVFTQRGSDLVGVLNRTNGTINRVG